MKTPAGNNGRGEMSEEERAEFHRRLSDLDAKLGKAKGVPDTKSQPGAREPQDGNRSQAMGDAMKIGLELVVGVAVGGFIGWQLDRWLGTAPWLLLIFFLLGFAGGLMNVIRAARRMQPKVLPGQKVPDDPDE